MNFSLVETPEDRHKFGVGAGSERKQRKMIKARGKQVTGSPLGKQIVEKGST